MKDVAIDRSLHNYAFIKSLFDQGHDYIDCFNPFAIQVLQNEKFMSTLQIQSAINKYIKLDIPLHVVNSIIKRLKKKNLILQKKSEKKYVLAKKGIEYKCRLENQKDVTRRINSVIGKIVGFFSNRGEMITESQASELIDTLLRNNRNTIIEYLNPSYDFKPSKSIRETPHIKLLVEFLSEIDNKDPESYSTIRDIILGSTIYATSYARDAVELQKLGERKFKGCTIYLDSNIVLSMLGLHEPEENTTALELLKLLKEFGFDLRIFQFTEIEICRLIKHYRSVLHKYPHDIRIDSIYSSLKRKGWRSSEVIEFITNFEKQLHTLGICVDYSYEIDSNSALLNDVELRTKLSEYKKIQTLNGQDHDLTSIETIRKIRKRKFRNLEESKAMFLTSDLKLFKFNFNVMGHKVNGTVCEVIPDRLLTNILWLKKPKFNLSLSAIIAAQSRELIIARAIWDQFYVVLQELYRDKKIDDGMIGMLFYHNYVEDELRKYDESEVEKITPSFVLGYAQARANTIDKTTSIKLKKKELELIDSFEKEIDIAVLKNDQKWFDKAEKIREGIRAEAKTGSSRRIAWAKIALSSIFIIFVLYHIYLNDWATLELFDILLGSILFISAVAGVRTKEIWSAIGRKWETRIYNKWISKGGFLEFVAEDDASIEEHIPNIRTNDKKSQISPSEKDRWRRSG